MHIPKTAGSALYSALESWATPSRSVRFGHGGADDWARFHALTEGDIEPLWLVGGHLGYPTFLNHLGEGWAYITVIRDPVERTLSQYAYVTSTPSHPWYGEVVGMSVDDFLAWYKERPHVVDQQCTLICGSPDPRAAATILQEKMALACVHERLPAMVDRLSLLLHHRLRMPLANVSPKRIQRGDVSGPTVQAIMDFNSADTVLYEQVRALEMTGRRLAR